MRENALKTVSPYILVLILLPVSAAAQVTLPDTLLTIADAEGFGCSVISDELHPAPGLWSFVSCPLSNAGRGETVVFQQETAFWVAQQRLTPPEQSGVGSCNFSALWHHEILALGCPLGPEGGVGVEHHGAVITYRWSDGAWQEDALLIPRQARESSFAHCGWFSAFYPSSEAEDVILLMGCPGLTAFGKRRLGGVFGFTRGSKSKRWMQLDLTFIPYSASAGRGCGTDIEIYNSNEPYGSALVLLRCGAWNSYLEHPIEEYLFRLDIPPGLSEEIVRISPSF